MKKSLMTSLVAVPLLSFSAMSFASEPVSLTGAQMDTVTAGTTSTNGTTTTVNKIAVINALQVNVSPVTMAQVNLLTIGSSNTAVVQSGNFIRVRQ